MDINRTIIFFLLRKMPITLIEKRIAARTKKCARVKKIPSLICNDYFFSESILSFEDIPIKLSLSFGSTLTCLDGF